MNENIQANLAPIEQIIADAKAGKMFILVDDEDRENEGDLIIPADYADAAAVNFMAKHGRGLICLSLAKPIVEKLGLPPMAQYNSSRHRTAFTVSIEAREGITTGISAADRAKTIADAINPKMGAQNIASPGHVFPLEARNGGVLVRAGHTEAAVDCARLAGLTEAGVICEIMNDDGTMARLPQLVEFAKTHGLNIATIADLIKYRRKTERLVERISEQKLDYNGTQLSMIVYKNQLNGTEHIAIVKGKPTAEETALVRMHRINIINDILGGVGLNHDDRGVIKALDKISKAQSGALVLIRNPKIDAISEMFLGKPKIAEAESKEVEIRNYGIGAQILLDLNIKKMQLITSSAPSIIALEGYGLELVGTQTLG